jgi:hypothetical protein
MAALTDGVDPAPSVAKQPQGPVAPSLASVSLERPVMAALTDGVDPAPSVAKQPQGPVAPSLASVCHRPTHGGVVVVHTTRPRIMLCIQWVSN